MRAKVLHALRIGVVAVRGFFIDKCVLRASALTYASLLSLVPLFAVIFSIFKGLNIHHVLRDNIPESMVAVIGDVIDHVIKYVDEVDVGFLGIGGVVLLLLTAIIVIGNIESAFNAIWGVRRSRTIFRKLSDYVSVLVIAPLSVGVAMAMTLSLESHAFVQRFGLERLVQWLLPGVPFLFVMIAFVFLFMLIPNTRVRLRPALTGAFVAALAWQLLQHGFVFFARALPRYEAVYGGFAQFLVFLIWVYTSWVVILFGAELSFACQNVATAGGERRALNASIAYREGLALRMAAEIAHSFESGREHWTVRDFSTRWNVPYRLANELLYQLVKGGILAEVSGAEVSFQPAREPRAVTVQAVLTAVRGCGSDGPRLRSVSSDDRIGRLLERMETAAVKEAGDISLADLGGPGEDG